MLRNDPSLRQDHDAGAELLDHVEAVGAEEHHAVASNEHAEQRSKEQASGDVEPGERLVEHEQIGVVDQRGRKQHPLTHAFRVGRHGRVAAVPQQKSLSSSGTLDASVRSERSRSRPTSIRYPWR